MRSNGGRGGVGWREWEIPVRCFGFDDRHNLGWIAAKIGLPDAIVRPHQRNGHPVRGKRRAVVDVVHTLKSRILPAIEDRKSVGEGKMVSVRVDLGGRRSIKKKKKT